MASRTLPGLGLKGFWLLGEDNWKDENDINLLTLSALVQPRVLEIVSADPGAPADGDIYFFDSAHPTQANKVAIRDNGAWAYIAAFEGMEIYNVDDSTKYRFDGAVLVDAGGGGGGGGGPMTVQTKTANYTAVLADADTVFTRMNLAGANTFTIPPNSAEAFPIGTKLFGSQMGAGITTLTPGVGVTLNSRGAALATAGQYAVWSAIQVAADVWTVSGDLA